MSVNPQPTALVTPQVGSGASVTVAQINLTRIGLYVYNPTSNVLWLAPLGTPAVVGGAGCIAVQPNQGVMLGGVPGNIPPWTNGLNAIYSTGGLANIAVLEFNP